MESRVNIKIKKPKKRGMTIPDEFLQEGKEIKEYASHIVIQKEDELGEFEFESHEIKSNVENRTTQMISDNTRYEGQWNTKTDKPHGIGTLVWADGSMYVGEMK